MRPTETSKQQPAARRRVAWNTSTRLAERKVRRQDDADGNAAPERKDATLSHTRCTSPSCQRRRRAAVATCTTPTTTGTREKETGKTKRVDAASSDHAETSTRAMIERAFDAALVSTLEDPQLTALDGSGTSSVVETSPGREPIRDRLTKTEADAKQWRAHYARRREQRQRAAEQQLARDQKSAEVQRAMRAARFEYEQRKLAIQSLQARVQREIQFLEATASELAKREALLDEAFDSYEQWLQREQAADADGHNARAG